MNLANQLTMLRVVLAAGVFFALMREGVSWHFSALVMFISAMLTDWLDGWYARKMNLTSPFGKIADPIADKILVLGTLLALIHHKELSIPIWAVFLILMRELLIGGIRVLAAAQGKSIAAERGGKIKTVVQTVSVSLILAIVVLRDRSWLPAKSNLMAAPLTVLCAIVALSSLWSYVRQYRQMLESSWS